MASDIPPQPRYPTLIELVFNYALFCGIGYLVGGALGAWCGAGLVTVLYAQSIWRAANALASDGEGGQTPGANPGAATERRD